jgi:hypothetical protein
MSAICPAAHDQRHYWYLDVCQVCGLGLTVSTASAYVTGDEDDHEDDE